MATTEENLSKIFDALPKLYRAIAEVWMESFLNEEELGSDKKLFNRIFNKGLQARIRQRYWINSGCGPNEEKIEDIFPFSKGYVTYSWIEFRKRSHASKKIVAVETGATMAGGFPHIFDFELTDREVGTIRSTAPNDLATQLKIYADKKMTKEAVKKAIATRTWE